MDLASPLRGQRGENRLDDLIERQVGDAARAVPDEYQPVAAVNFIAAEGEKYAEYFEDELKGLTGRRRNIVAGVLAMDTHEMELAKKLRMGLRAIPGVTVYGPAEGQPRTPTVSFTMEGYAPEQVTEVFGSKGINSSPALGAIQPTIHPQAHLLK